MGKTKTDKQPKKAAVPKKMKPVKTKLTKSQVFDALAEDSGMAKSEVKKVWGSLERLIEASICDEGYGQFSLPGLMKVTTVRRPAIKARRGINPFTKEETWFKAKPLRLIHATARSTPQTTGWWPPSVLKVSLSFRQLMRLW